MVSRPYDLDEDNDAKQQQAREAVDIASKDASDNTKNEDVLDRCGDLAELDEVKNEASFVMAGVTPERAKASVRLVYLRVSTATFIEAYGRSIIDQALATRRNLNITGLDALDLRPLEPIGKRWDFTKPSDQQEARKLAESADPMRMVGVPPGTPFFHLESRPRL